MLRSLLMAAAVAASLSACAIRTPTLAVPAHLEGQVEILDLAGMGGGRSGTFQLAGVPGSFSRGADRLGVADPLLVRYTGGGHFALAESALSPNLSGHCAYREGQFNAGPVSLTPQRFAYHCQFSSGPQPMGSLFIADRNAPTGALHGRAEREGTIDYRGQRLVLRSIHRFAGGTLPTPHPLGYMFVADGREVGAVDLNGTRARIMVPRSGPYRGAVIAGSLALAVLWDPAEVQPDY